LAAKKIAIVTGANRGIGREIARQLMQADVFVVLGSRDLGKGEEALAQIQGSRSNAAAYSLDVNDTRSVRRLVEKVEKAHGAPSILVNNAGVYPEATEAKVVDTSTAMWRETFETNLFGAVRMCREVVPLMQRRRDGRIVNISWTGQTSRGNWKRLALSCGHCRKMIGCISGRCDSPAKIVV